jgi:hypothetical protein
MKKKYKLSDEMCQFMDVPIGSSSTKGDVSKYLVNYIEKNNLVKDMVIYPDEKLKTIINESHYNRLILETYKHFLM